MDTWCLGRRLELTTDDAGSILKELDGVTGHIGHTDVQQVLAVLGVPHPDVILGAGDVQVGRATER